MAEPYRPLPYRPGEALLALYRRRGPVINSGVGRHGYTYLLGAEANKFVFANADAFSWRETFETLAVVDGPTALIVSDGDDHRRRRSVVAPGLRHRRDPGLRADHGVQHRHRDRQLAARSAAGHLPAVPFRGPAQHRRVAVRPPHSRPLRLSWCTASAFAGSHPPAAANRAAAAAGRCAGMAARGGRA